MVASSFILIEKQASYACITLNRPEKRNAFDDVLLKELLQALDHLAACPELCALLLEANGSHFSAGADLAWMQRMVQYRYEQNLEEAQLLAAVMQRLYDFPKVTLAKVQGPALGGGIGLIACCDIAFASTQAQFCFSETRLGLTPSVISPYVLKAMGKRAAQRWMLSAETFDAQTAQAFQLVHEICSPETLDHTVSVFLQELLKNSPDALQECKKLIRHVEASAYNSDLIRFTADHIAKRRISAQGQEGLRAFLEKRKPQWQQ